MTDTIVELHIRFQPEYFNRVAQSTIPECWVGYCSHILYEGGGRLDGQPVQMWGFTKQELIENVKAELVARGLKGILRTRMQLTPRHKVTCREFAERTARERAYKYSVKASDFVKKAMAAHDKSCPNCKEEK